jgi:CPA2 family monovalent cation:H+ antiporter-2
VAATADLSAYRDVLVVLGTAGLVVPLMHRYKISSVLGFLAAGVALGPHGLGALADYAGPLGWVTVRDSKALTAVAELGVVLLLFIIGLELSLQRLVTMRRLVFGLGTLQVLLSALVIGAAVYLAGQTPEASVLIGLALALSSTAIVVELLARQRRSTSHAGRASFAVLLAQDLAVVPILFLVGILDPKTKGTLLSDLTIAGLQSVVAVALVVVIGKYLLRPLFRLVAQTKSQELFMAATLFVVLGTGVISAAFGLSMALGAFVAGLLLAETEFSKAIEATVDPFKGLLLGVFFFTVGMGLDLGALLARPATILVLTLALVLVKIAILIPLARGFGLAGPVAAETAMLIGPGGEFAFIIMTLAVAQGSIATPVAGLVTTVVSLSMMALPLLAHLAPMLARRIAASEPVAPELLVAPSGDRPVDAIVVGHGRVGQVVADMLAAHNITHLCTDTDAEEVVLARQKGRAVYYGDVRNPEFLKRCGIAGAKLVVITSRNPGEVDDVVSSVRVQRTDVLIVARARDGQHARALYALGVTDAVPETLEASLHMAEAALVELGIPTGPVIASIHERRDVARRALQRPDGSAKAPLSRARWRNV